MASLLVGCATYSNEHAGPLLRVEKAEGPPKDDIRIRKCAVRYDLSNPVLDVEIVASRTVSVSETPVHEHLATRSQIVWEKPKYGALTRRWQPMARMRSHFGNGHSYHLTKKTGVFPLSNLIYREDANYFDRIGFADSESSVVSSRFLPFVFDRDYWYNVCHVPKALVGLLLEGPINLLDHPNRSARIFERSAGCLLAVVASPLCDAVVLVVDTAATVGAPLVDTIVAGGVVAGDAAVSLGAATIDGVAYIGALAYPDGVAREDDVKTGEVRGATRTRTRTQNVAADYEIQAHCEGWIGTTTCDSSGLASIPLNGLEVVADSATGVVEVTVRHVASRRTIKHAQVVDFTRLPSAGPTEPLVAELLLSAARKASGTYVREYEYQAGERDSKATARAAAIEEIRRRVLEETVGTVVASEFNSRTWEGTGGAKEKTTAYLRAASLGCVRVQPLQETWQDMRYYMKAEVVIDGEELQRQLRK